MRSVFEERVENARAIERKILRGDARYCSAPPFGRVCKALWPLKTAEELASRTGASVRTAGYEISGEQHPSAQSIRAVLEEIIPKWK